MYCFKIQQAKHNILIIWTTS